MSTVKVMISLNVASMQKSADLLVSRLRKHGINVWICYEIKGGDNFRGAIVNAIKSANIVILLINKKWAQSGECEDEYSLAKRLNLTSHESGRTQRGHARQPILLPVAFADLGRWEDYQHIELLAASTNFIVHNGNTLLEGNSEQTISTLISSINSHNFGSGEIPAAKPQDKEVILDNIVVGNTYLGNTWTEQDLGFAMFHGCISTVLKITEYEPQSGKVKAVVTEKEISKKVNVPIDFLPMPTQEWINREYSEDDLICEGTFTPLCGKLYLEGKRIEHKDGPVYSHILKDFWLVAYDRKMIGISKYKKSGAVNSVFMQQYM